MVFVTLNQKHWKSVLNFDSMTEWPFRRQNDEHNKILHSAPLDAARLADKVMKENNLETTLF